MSPAIAIKALGLWFAILVLAIANGALREKALVPLVGAVAGRAASGVILAGCIFAIAFAAVPWYGNLTVQQWFSVGLFWFSLTLLFEFGLGRFVQHKTWQELFEAYTFRGGNIWPVVLLATLASPWLAARLRGFV